MIKVTISEFAEKRGITTAYQLQKALDIQPGVAADLWKGDMSRIGFSSLDRLCSYFNCQPDKFLRYVPEDEELNDSKPSRQKKTEAKGETKAPKPPAHPPFPKNKSKAPATAAEIKASDAVKAKAESDKRADKRVKQ